MLRWSICSTCNSPHQGRHWAPPVHAAMRSAPSAMRCCMRILHSPDASVVRAALMLGSCWEPDAAIGERHGIAALLTRAFRCSQPLHQPDRQRGHQRDCRGSQAQCWAEATLVRGFRVTASQRSRACGAVPASTIACLGAPLVVWHVTTQPADLAAHRLWRLRSQPGRQPYRRRWRSGNRRSAEGKCCPANVDVRGNWCRFWVGR